MLNVSVVSCTNEFNFSFSTQSTCVATVLGPEDTAKHTQLYISLTAYWRNRNSGYCVAWHSKNTADDAALQQCVYYQRKARTASSRDHV